MNAASDPSQFEPSPLEQLIAEYLAAEESGQTMIRDQWVRRAGPLAAEFT